MQTRKERTHGLYRIPRYDAIGHDRLVSFTHCVPMTIWYQGWKRPDIQYLRAPPVDTKIQTRNGHCCFRKWWFRRDPRVGYM